jgi:hypothetical protein
MNALGILGHRCQRGIDEQALRLLASRSWPRVECDGFRVGHAQFDTCQYSDDAILLFQRAELLGDTGRTCPKRSGCGELARRREQQPYQ